MPEASSPASKPFMSGSCPLRTPLWRSLVAITCPLARRSHAFLPRLIQRRWRHCGRSSKKISWPASLSPLQVACGIEAAQQWVVVDVDGTKQAARKLALPQLETLPEPHRRFDQVCAPSYLGRKRGEVGRTRTTILQAHTHQFLGTFGGVGNGNYRGELKRALEVISNYATPL